MFFAILAGLLALMFWRTFTPHYVPASNDGPYGAMVAKQCQEQGGSGWQCNNWLGDATAPGSGLTGGIKLVGGETHHIEWDEADILGALISLGCLMFPIMLVGGQLYRDYKGWGPM